jgi:Ca2+:H+ antiporter
LQTIGGLLNFTFGNAVELITSIIALKEGQIRVVQTAALGTIISNLLLILGMSFFAGGIYYHYQTFNMNIAQTSSSLMILACIGLIIPAAFTSSITSVKYDEHKGKLLGLSHGMAIVLLIIYILYLLFQVSTTQNLWHTTLFFLSCKINFLGLLVENPYV